MSTVATTTQSSCTQQMAARAENQSLGCCGSLFWTAGFRDGLSDANCQKSNGGVYPYFTEGAILANGTRDFGSDYQGCGNDQSKDWVWQLKNADGTAADVRFTDAPSSAALWSTTANSGAPSNRATRLLVCSARHWSPMPLWTGVWAFAGVVNGLAHTAEIDS